MESLAAKEIIFNNVIDGWVDLLNYEERYRNRSSLRRYFFKTNILRGGVLEYEVYDFNKRFEWFMENLKESANNKGDVLTLRNVDLVFFPHLIKRHYYCIVFNLKKYTIELLDNRSLDVDIEDMYDYDVHILTSMLVNHLKMVGHAAWEGIQNADKVKLRGSWQTKNNIIDCGVFLMRAMETYMGGGSRNWYTGFTKEGPVQDKQLDMLRKKYAAKMLLSDYNDRRRFIQLEISRYYNMDKASREQIRDMAKSTRHYRLLKY